MDYNENILIQMQKVSKAALRAKEMEDKSVVFTRKEVLDEAVITLKENPETSLVLFGVKNTSQISNELIDKLQTGRRFLFHTIDKMAERGRAVDVDIINPLTGKVMTGSSSGGCVNILWGINELAIGTDGGGSVLAPAISTGLYSIMGKGLGLRGCNTRVSTDNISFTPGIGVISHSFELCKEAIKLISEVEDIESFDLEDHRLRVVIPKEGSIILPNGMDMRRVIDSVVNEISPMVEIIEESFGDLHDRNKAISNCERIFSSADIIITAEGPIDIYGTGDSVLGTWGATGSEIQNSSGKYLLKVANMIDATAITIPTGELGVGIVITAKKGMKWGKAAIRLGDMIKRVYKLPPLFDRYFIDGYKQEDIGFLR